MKGQVLLLTLLSLWPHILLLSTFLPHEVLRTLNRLPTLLLFHDSLGYSIQCPSVLLLFLLHCIFLWGRILGCSLCWLELTILLPRPPNYWDYKCVSLCPILPKIYTQPNYLIRLSSLKMFTCYVPFHGKFAKNMFLVNKWGKYTGLGKEWVNLAWEEGRTTLRVTRMNLEPSPDWNQNTGSGDQNQGDGLGRVPEESVHVKKDTDGKKKKDTDVPGRI